jgi:hypothetical protein
MKNKFWNQARSAKALLLIALTTFLCVGCATPPEEYSLNGEEEGSATIEFLTETFKGPGNKSGYTKVSALSYQGKALEPQFLSLSQHPFVFVIPGERWIKLEKNWNPVVFPSGKTFKIGVYVINEQKREKVNIFTNNGLKLLFNTVKFFESPSYSGYQEFLCPPLEDGGRYCLFLLRGYKGEQSTYDGLLESMTGLDISEWVPPALVLIDGATGSVIKKERFMPFESYIDKTAFFNKFIGN